MLVSYVIQNKGIIVGVVSTNIDSDNEMREILDMVSNLEGDELEKVLICILKGRGYYADSGAVREIELKFSGAVEP